jgi:Fe-S oxidoreductase
MPIETFLAAHLDRHGPPDRADSIAENAAATLPGALYHGHCHQKAMVGTADTLRVLRALSRRPVEEIDAGCCGMAGSFGHEKEHYDVARAVGEQRLFPAVRNRGDADVLLSGFSCRCQIEHHTTARPIHWVEALYGAPLDGQS